MPDKSPQYRKKSETRWLGGEHRKKDGCLYLFGYAAMIGMFVASIIKEVFSG